MDWWTKSVVVVGILCVAQPAVAQSTVAQDTEPPAVAGQTSLSQAATAPDPETRPPRFGRNIEHSVGFRLWVFNLPAWEVGMFAHVQGPWSGPLTITAGPEYVYRRGSMDIVLGLQYTGLGTDPGYIRGSNDQAIALERVQSGLYAVYANALFLWRTRLTDWFEFQYGVGIGLGYVGGDLYRTQVYPNGAGGYNECMGPGNPAVPGPGGAGQWCDAANNHFLNANGSRYAEPRLTSGGNIPDLVPWVSLPHLAAHFRPHRNIDIRLDFGFAIIGFYGGLATHFIFD